MRKELPNGTEGYVEKRLSWEKYLGCDSEVAVEAYKIYLKRASTGAKGSQEQDWLKAEEVVRKRFTNELLEKLAA
jgi:hypothetical protein